MSPLTQGLNYRSACDEFRDVCVVCIAGGVVMMMMIVETQGRPRETGHQPVCRPRWLEHLPAAKWCPTLPYCVKYHANASMTDNLDFVVEQLDNVIDTFKVSIRVFLLG